MSTQERKQMNSTAANNKENSVRFIGYVLKVEQVQMRRSKNSKFWRLVYYRIETRCAIYLKRK